MGNPSSRTEPLVLILRKMGSGALWDPILPLKRDFELSDVSSCNDCVVTPGAGCSNSCKKSYFEAITSNCAMGMKAPPASHRSSIILRNREFDHGQK